MTSLMNMLARAQNGNYFTNVAKVCGMDTATAEACLEKLCPAIARQLKTKAEGNAQAFESLLDLLDEGGDSADLESADAMMGAEAISGGKAVLADVFGALPAAVAAMKQLARAIDNGSVVRFSAIAASSVLAGLSKTHGAPMPLAGDTQHSGGILGAIISAVVTDASQGVVRQLAPQRRRPRSYSSYFGRQHMPLGRPRAKTPSPNDLFGQMLGTRK